MENNEKQDVKIGKIETDVSWIKTRLNHLGDKINWNRNLIVLSILVPIFIFIMTQLVK